MQFCVECHPYKRKRQEEQKMRTVFRLNVVDYREKRNVMMVASKPVKNTFCMLTVWATLDIGILPYTALKEELN
jgi:hypothetical protein